MLENHRRAEPFRIFGYLIARICLVRFYSLVARSQSVLVQQLRSEDDQTISMFQRGRVADVTKAEKVHEDKSITSVAAFGTPNICSSDSRTKLGEGTRSVLAPAVEGSMNQPQQKLKRETISTVVVNSAEEEDQPSLKSHQSNESGVPSFAGTDTSSCDLCNSPVGCHDASNSSTPGSSNSMRGTPHLTSPKTVGMLPTIQAAATEGSAGAGAGGPSLKMLKPNNIQGSPVLYRLPEFATTANPRQQPPPPPAPAPPSSNDHSRPGLNNASFDSNLSLRDMYNEVLNNQKDYFQEENGDSSDEEKESSKARSRSNSIRTPPSSLHGAMSQPGKSPPLHALPGPACISSGALSAAGGVASFMGSTTSSTASSGPNTGGNLFGISSQQQQPMLYSAIGSLEDPASSSYKGWKQKAAAGGRSKTTKFDFPSSSATLIAPVGKQKNDLLESKQNKKAQGVLATQVVDQQQKQPPPQPPTEEKKVEKLDNTAPASKTTTTSTTEAKKPVSALRRGKLSTNKNLVQGEGGATQTKSTDTASGDKKVTIAKEDLKRRKVRKPKKAAELFRPSSDAYTPRMGKKQIKYKPAEMRTPVQQMASPLGTLSRPNFRDALRRVAMIIHQHIVKIERRFEGKPEVQSRDDDGLFSRAMRDAFSEERYVTPRYKCTMVRVPMARPGMMVGMKRVRVKYAIPTEAEIYDFAERLFKTVQLSSECSIVCLIYVERLMESSKVPLLSSTWRPIFMCGLLLASKVWQDLSSWNIEFASVYPQYSLDSINKLELQFLKLIKWDLYISSSAYAKYYFALRSLVEKTDFRQRYNRMVGGVGAVEASEARKIEERSTMVKEEALLQLSRSM